MARLYLMVKRKGAKTYQGAIPARKGMTKARLKKALKGRVNKKYTVTIASSSQLKNYIKWMAGKTVRARRSKTTKRKATRRNSVRRKTVRRKKRVVRKKKR